MVADQWIKTGVPGTTTIVQQAEFEYPHVYNSLGLMDREPVRKATGEYRILALGDSFTDGASTWPAFLQRMLSASRPDSRLTVINGDNGGSDPFWFLTQMCARFSPSRSAAPWEEAADVLVPANQR